MFDVRIVLTVCRTILTSNITIPHRQNNSNVKHHNSTASEQLQGQTSQYQTCRTTITSNITIPHRQNNSNVKHHNTTRQNNSNVKHHNSTPSEHLQRQTSQYHTVRTILTSNITIPHRQNNSSVKHHNTTPPEQF
jgi:mannitol/fructose-specific phosphotransferase system IIA component (Ntr-type)